MKQTFDFLEVTNKISEETCMRKHEKTLDIHINYNV